MPVLTLQIFSSGSCYITEAPIYIGASLISGGNNDKTDNKRT